MGTHKIFANYILSYADSEVANILDEKKFIWGNIKPDYVSKYKLKKHFYDESINMIIDKIYFLAGLSHIEIMNYYGKKKFSAEVGVVCHFLCDYFCYAHNQKWKFKSAMKKHVLYERRLSKMAKEFDFTKNVNKSLKIGDIPRFIEENLRCYERIATYESDLVFAMYICNSVVNAILYEVSRNEYVAKAV